MFGNRRKKRMLRIVSKGYSDDSFRKSSKRSSSGKKRKKSLFS